MTIAIVTDSTSDLPHELARVSGIHVVPLNVHFGDMTFLDGVSITADEFFVRLKAGPDFPKTSQPSAGAFVAAYQRIAAQGVTQILSLHLSSKVSGTYNSAMQAKAELAGKGPQIEVVDTLQASMALGLVVMQVADALKQGANFDQATELAKSASSRAKFFGLLDTLEYLHKGGRVGKAKLLLGSLLNVKPILGLVDGVAHPVGRARSHAKGVVQITEAARVESPLAALAVMYGSDRAGAETIAASLKDVAPGGAPVIAQFGPVLGTYLGPEALGVCLIKAG